MRIFRFFLILCYSLIIACNSADPSFCQEETLTPEPKPLHGITNILKLEVKPPYLILQKKQLSADSSLHANDHVCDKQNVYDNYVIVKDSLYAIDAMYATSGLTPYMVNYYADPDMKRVYVNDKRVVFCYGYKKQIEFMDFNFNLIQKVKFKYETPTCINSKNLGDVNLSYACSYLGKYYFYTLFIGILSDKHRSFSSQGAFLEVYDLDGNPIIRYHLDGRLPVYFVVDEETFTLYGPSEYNDPEDHLVVYKLKGLL